MVIVFLAAVTMAESLRYKVEEHLTCSVCLKPFKDPKVLPCLHSYCHVCIVNLAKNANSNTINCPECRLAVEVRKMYTYVHLCGLLCYFTLSNTRLFNSITRRALVLNGLIKPQIKLSAHVPTWSGKLFSLPGVDAHTE
jgi:hypothetical protein